MTGLKSEQRAVAKERGEGESKRERAKSEGGVRRSNCDKEREKGERREKK